MKNKKKLLSQAKKSKIETMNSGFNIKRVFGLGGDAEASDFEEVRISADGKVETEGQLAVDVYEDESKLDILAPLAGVEMKDVNLRITDDVITIEGKREKPEDVGDNYMVQECFWGPFRRSVVLPEAVKRDQIKATFRAGVLHISVPKSENRRTKVIQIEQI